MFAALFILGSFWFWSLILIECLLLFWFVEEDWPGYAAISFVGVFLLLWLFGDFNVISWLAVVDWRHVIAGIGAYLVAGTIWSISKWWFFVKATRRRFDRYVKEHVETYSYSKQQARERAKSLHGKPLATANKRRIITWMTYWPWSAVWTIINDPVRRLFKEIFYRIQKVYEAIANSAYKDIEAEEAREKEEAEVKARMEKADNA